MGLESHSAILQDFGTLSQVQPRKHNLLRGCGSPVQAQLNAAGREKYTAYVCLAKHKEEAGDALLPVVAQHLLITESGVRLAAARRTPSEWVPCLRT